MKQSLLRVKGYVYVARFKMKVEIDREDLKVSGRYGDYEYEIIVAIDLLIANDQLVSV